MLSGRTHGATHTPRRRALPRQRGRGVPLSEGGLDLREPPSDVVDDLMSFDRSGPSRFLIAGDKERTVLMFRLIWIVSIHTRYFQHHYMPTNIVKPRVLWRLVYLVPVVAGCDCSWRWRSGAQAASCSAGVRMPTAE